MCGQRECAFLFSLCILRASEALPATLFLCMCVSHISDIYRMFVSFVVGEVHLPDGILPFCFSVFPAAASLLIASLFFLLVLLLLLLSVPAYLYQYAIVFFFLCSFFSFWMLCCFFFLPAFTFYVFVVFVVYCIFDVWRR
ncbi:hypothetical protein, unlikely [Trypanosoma congolense IL3000]|uniref:Uncharacterized protein n=1 Tax=Trypanosoma congolense (strain IL3000) TaxID=1068625 RepID=F9W957_TRYCI|nr:hypothetical protein, unlikely [Trypanosoma congolense IL3000]